MATAPSGAAASRAVSMKSGLEGRNNWADEDKFILELLSQ